MQLYKLNKAAYEHYCKSVKGNSEASYELAQKKLTRNIALSMKVELDKNKILYIYGKLHIFTRGNRIVWIKNIKKTPNWFYKDMKEYRRLNELLEIV